jgi:hypothetical protein
METRKWTDVPDRVKIANLRQNYPIKSGLSEPTKRDLQKWNLRWKEINDITWKLCDDEVVRVPAVHGKWGGFNTGKALAWVIELGWVNPDGRKIWFARVRDGRGDWGFGPSNLARARAAALARVRKISFKPDVAAGERTFSSVIDLNAYQARLVDNPGTSAKPSTDSNHQRLVHEATRTRGSK